MTSKDFEKFTKTETSRRLKMNRAKGMAYANSDDRLANFKRQAEMQGLRPAQICFVYATKHFDGICSGIRHADVDVAGEHILGRIDDLQNYLDLLRAILNEEEESVC